MTKRRILVAVVCLVFTGLCGRAFGDEAVVAWASEIEAKVERIKAEADPMARYQLASELPSLARQASQSNQITDKIVDNISSLLNAEDDAVRFWAALALGQLGPRATIAVPELERALKEAEARDRLSIVGPTLSSADGIRAALKRITGRTYEPNR